MKIKVKFEFTNKKGQKKKVNFLIDRKTYEMLKNVNKEERDFYMLEEYRYYKLTKLFLIEDRKNNISGVDYQVAVEYKDISGYEVYPLHGNPNSIKGLRPSKYYNEKGLLCDKLTGFIYNQENKRYSYFPYGNKLEYKFGNTTTFSIGMRVYPFAIVSEDCIFECYDLNGNIKTYGAKTFTYEGTRLTGIII